MYLYPVEIKEAEPCVHILYLPHITLYFSNNIHKINTHCKEFGKCREVGKKFTSKCRLCMSFYFFLLHTLASLVAQMVKNLPAMQETWVRSPGREDPLEKEMTTHSRIVAWRIPWTEERDRLQSREL